MGTVSRGSIIGTGSAVSTGTARGRRKIVGTGSTET